MRLRLLCTYVLSTLIGSAIGLQAQLAPPPALDTPCIAQSLTNYLNMFGTDSNGAGCSIGIQNFSEFAFPTRTGTGGFTPDTSDQIEVTPAIGGFTISQIGGQFSVGDNQTALYQINYRFDIDPVPTASGASLGMDPPFGDVSIDQLYCADSTFFHNSDNGITSCDTGNNFFAPQDLHVDDTNPPLPGTLVSSWTTGLVPLNPIVMNFATTELIISLDGTNLLLGSGFDSATGDTFIAGPEPSAWLLILGGLLVMIMSKRISHVSS